MAAESGGVEITSSEGVVVVEFSCIEGEVVGQALLRVLIEHGSGIYTAGSSSASECLGSARAEHSATRCWVGCRIALCILSHDLLLNLHQLILVLKKSSCWS